MTARNARARLDLIPLLIQENRQNEKTLRLLQNGFIPEALSPESRIESRKEMKQYPDNELSFLELATFSTWFYLHPEKLCGKETPTGSQAFPLMVEGDREKIEQTIRSGMKEIGEAKLKTNTSLLEMEAMALEIELKLLEL